MSRPDWAEVHRLRATVAAGATPTTTIGDRAHELFVSLHPDIWRIARAKGGPMEQDRQDRIRALIEAPAEQAERPGRLDAAMALLDRKERREFFRLRRLAADGKMPFVYAKGGGIAHEVFLFAHPESYRHIAWPDASWDNFDMIDAIVAEYEKLLA